MLVGTTVASGPDYGVAFLVALLVAIKGSADQRNLPSLEAQFLSLAPWYWWALGGFLRTTLTSAHSIGG